ncbi:MAG: sugar phosphate isomerase/epimerase [Oscillospiraceae bacterium]|jgi:L-ribulose-5-phosphate 3-epimerase|nr:sugar phosphate isomerase/epimerase [Oscillospiraceae bacterium]
MKTRHTLDILLKTYTPIWKNRKGKVLRMSDILNHRKYGFFLNGCYAPISQEEAMEILAKLGYSAVEVPWHPDAGRESLTISAQNAAKNGLMLSEVVLQLDYVKTDEALRQKQIDDTVRAVAVCGEAGISTINLFTGPVPWGASPLRVGKDLSAGDAWRMLFSAFDKLVPAAEQAGVNLAVENVWCHLCHDFFTCRHLTTHYNSPRLGVNFDPSHDVLSGNTDMRFLVNSWGKDAIKHIHLKDAAGIMEGGKFIFPLLGEGLVDWDGLRAGLTDIGYDGVLSMECESSGYGLYFDGQLSKIAAVHIQAARALLG